MNARLVYRIFAGLACLMAIGLFFWPLGVLVQALFDRGTAGDGIPRAAWALHRSLGPRVEKWATQRVAAGEAAKLSSSNISGTEWPLFGSAFYLMALENLQAEWEKRSGPGQEPRVWARPAIEAATRLVADPQHAHWVREHWGEKYLERENLFYRMLLISTFTAHERLLRTGQYLAPLRQQVDGLSAELDAAPSGLLNDYPGQCYPVDVAFAIRAIRHADTVLGTDHAALVERELRAFRPGELPGYFVDQVTGETRVPPRGCSTMPFLMHAAVLWPAHAAEWDALVQRDLWQSRWWAAGYREFPAEEKGNRANVDSGPVMAGFGAAACAFGIGSTRAQGDAARARVLTLEALAVSWPIAGGGFLVPRIVSDVAHAPLLGECGLLFAMTQPASRPVRTDPALPIPGLVWIVGALQLGLGILLVLLGVRWWRRAVRRSRAADA